MTATVASQTMGWPLGAGPATVTGSKTLRASFLKNSADARILIDNTFEKPDVSLNVDRIAEPQTTNYARIGTAFDSIRRSTPPTSVE